MRATRLTAAGLCALLLACGGKAAPEPTAPTPVAKVTDAKPAPAPEPKGPFLYKYEGKTGPVYLLGTIHLMVSAKDDLDPVVWQSFTASKHVVLELDPTNVSMVSATLKMLNLNGPDLKSQLTAEEWTKLTDIVKNVPPNALNKMQPWAVGMLLELASITDTSKSMELEFVAYAKENNITIGALETVDDQLAALSESSNIDDLKKAIAEYGGTTDALAALVKAYKEGDLAAFEEAFAGDGEDENPKRTEKLLKERNEKWIPQIEKMLTEGGDIFIAVGAAHLYGEHGVLKLLADRGYHAERMLGAAAQPEKQAFYFGAMRSAPSSRMTSPLR